MKLLIIMYMFGKAVAAIDPHTNSLDYCVQTSIPQRQEQDASDWAATVASGRAANLKRPNGVLFRGPADTTYQCEFHNAAVA